MAKLETIITTKPETKIVVQPEQPQEYPYHSNFNQERSDNLDGIIKALVATQEPKKIENIDEHKNLKIEILKKLLSKYVNT